MDSLQSRVDLASPEILAILDKHNLFLNAELKFAPQGIVPTIVFLDKPMENENTNTEPTETNVESSPVSEPTESVQSAEAPESVASEQPVPEATEAQ